MKLVILGAAGRTGREVMRQALAAGHTVTAFMREQEDIGIQEARLRVIHGDARSEADLSSALLGQDAVISTLGSSKRKDDLMTRSMEALIGATRATGVKRVVLLSSFLVAPQFRPTGMVKLLNFLFKHTVIDKHSSEELLRQSNLKWTIVYATRLDAAPAGSSIRVVLPTETVTIKNGIARADVAKYLLVQVTNPNAVGMTSLITTT